MGSTDNQLREKYDKPLVNITLPAGLVLAGIVGFCPVTAKGTIDGYPFFFFARESHWSFQLAPTITTNPKLVGTLVNPVALGCNEIGQITWEASERYAGFSYRELWPKGPASAGYMTNQEVLSCLIKATCVYRQRGWVLDCGA